MATNALRASSPPEQERWTVDLTLLGDGLAGCFNYVQDARDATPRMFGGGGCADWPRGSFIEYSNFSVEHTPDDQFAVPADCVDESTGKDASACWSCHDQP